MKKYKSWLSALICLTLLSGIANAAPSTSKSSTDKSFVKQEQSKEKATKKKTAAKHPSKKGTATNATHKAKSQGNLKNTKQPLPED